MSQRFKRQETVGLLRWRDPNGTIPGSCGRIRGSVQKLVGFGGHRYDRSGDVDLEVVNALGIAIDPDGHAQRGSGANAHS